MDQKHRSYCPLSVALEVFGDRWSLLVVRDLMFKGRTTFKEFQEAEEGIATNVLADRLQRLEAHGIVVRRRDPYDARRVIYGLTEKGIDLAPILVEMIVWGARDGKTNAPPAVIRRMREDREQFLAEIRSRWEATQIPEEEREE
jgi:DNA-binding HxlR family transcriptional regulator